MKLSEYFHGMADAVANSGHDRELTEDERHDLRGAAQRLSEEEASSEATFLHDQGSEMDHWTLPIGACIIAIWNWIKG